MMANPEISSTQEQGLAAVPPQGRPAGAEAIRQESRASEISATARARVIESDEERLPLTARVLLGDLAVAIVALVVLFVIEVQRFGDASFHLRREAWGEDLAVLFGVSAVFGGITFLLARARHLRVAVVQAVVTALVLAAAITSAATGDPQPTPDTTTPVSTTGNPG